MLYQQEDKLDLSILIALSRSTQMIQRRSAAILKDNGLTITQFGVLEALYHKGDMTINEIIESLLSTSGNMTVVINNLEKEQLINRYVNPKDRRSALIAISERGRSRVEEIFPPHLLDLKECFSVYSEDEKEQLLDLLKKLAVKSPVK
nr:MarR family transcriptional regulator [uncultured Acetobacterium sp.]